MNGQEASYEVEYPERLSRLLIFVKIILLIPHIIALYILGVVAAIVHFLNWFAVLFTGNTPEGLFNFGVGYERWRARVAAYALLQTDKYPPFSMEDDPNYPVRVLATRPQKIARWRCFFQWIMSIGALIIYFFIGIAAYIAVFFAWFAILITGRYPKGLFNMASTAIRYGMRLDLYYFLYSETFPTTNT
jgi:hypothetical protein